MKTGNIDMKYGNLLIILAIIVILLSLTSIFLNFYKLNKQVTGYALGFVNLTVNTQITINVTNDTINWGQGIVTPPFTNASLTTNQSTVGTALRGNWSGANAKALVIANIGNINCSLSLTSAKTAATFFGGSAGDQQYQWNVTTKDSAAACINSTALGVFVNTNTTSGGTKFCSHLNFLTASNEIFVDIKLVVPYDATNTGVQSDIITITADTAG